MDLGIDPNAWAHDPSGLPLTRETAEQFKQFALAHPDDAEARRVANTILHAVGMDQIPRPSVDPAEYREEEIRYRWCGTERPKDPSAGDLIRVGDHFEVWADDRWLRLLSSPESPKPIGQAPSTETVEKAKSSALSKYLPMMKVGLGTAGQMFGRSVMDGIMKDERKRQAAQQALQQSQQRHSPPGAYERMREFIERKKKK